MVNKAFNTYKKSTKIRFTIGDWLLISLFICLALLCLNAEFTTNHSKIIEEIFRIIAFGILALLTYIFIRSLSKKEKLNGEITGPLRLFSDKIKIGEKIILLSEIKHVNLKAEDFEGKRLFLLYNTLYPKISNGYDNTLEITLISNEKIEINFKQNYENEFSKKSKDFLILYHKNNKLSFLNLIDILNITNYSEIQKFKKNIFKK